MSNNAMLRSADILCDYPSIMKKVVFKRTEPNTMCIVFELRFSAEYILLISKVRSTETYNTITEKICLLKPCRSKTIISTFDDQFPTAEKCAQSAPPKFLMHSFPPNVIVYCVVGGKLH